MSWLLNSPTTKTLRRSDADDREKNNLFPGEMEEEVSEPKALLTALRPFTNFTITVAAFTK